MHGSLLTMSCKHTDVFEMEFFCNTRLPDNVMLAVASICLMSGVAFPRFFVWRFLLPERKEIQPGTLS